MVEVILVNKTRETVNCKCDPLVSISVFAKIWHLTISTLKYDILMSICQVRR